MPQKFKTWEYVRVQIVRGKFKKYLNKTGQVIFYGLKQDAETQELVTFLESM